MSSMSMMSTVAIACYGRDTLFADLADVLNGEQLACCGGLGEVAAVFAGGRDDVAAEHSWLGSSCIDSWLARRRGPSDGHLYRAMIKVQWPGSDDPGVYGRLHGWAAAWRRWVAGIVQTKTPSVDMM
ncbi:hypothetical protein ACLOJK_037270 [Asimina triloba]